MYEIIVSILAVIGLFSLFYFAMLIAFIRYVFFSKEEESDFEEELWKK